MATSKILLGLIAFSSFQVQNARCDEESFWSGMSSKVRDDISESFWKAVDNVTDMSTGTLIAENKLKVLRIAIVKFDEFHENMERLYTQAHSEIPTCKNQAAMALAGPHSDIRNSVVDCFRKHEEDTIEAVDIAMKTLLSKKYNMRRLVEQFQACENDECELKIRTQATTEEREQRKLLNEVNSETLKTNAWLLANFRNKCLTRGEDDFQRQAKDIIESFKTCKGKW